MNKFLFYLSLLTLFACSSANKKQLKNELTHNEVKYAYNDKNGKFVFKSTSGFVKKENSFFTKQSLEMLSKTKDNALEQSISFSTLGSVKKSKMILRPKNSEYSVWFDGKKFTSRMKIISSKKMVELSMESPEPKWNGVKQFKFPSTRIPSCFFTQVVECAKVMGALSSKQKMNFYILWEGYPYLNETFTDFPNELFSKAEIENEGKQKNGEVKFSLLVAGQSIVYILDKNNKIKKMFWVTQGISILNKEASMESNKVESNEQVNE
jgi:hypothetical protein